MTTEPPTGDPSGQSDPAHDPAGEPGPDPVDAAAEPAAEPDVPDSELPTGPIDPAALREAAAQGSGAGSALRSLGPPVWALLGAGAVALVVIVSIIATTAGSAGPTVTGSVQGIGGSVAASTTTDGTQTPTSSSAAGSSSNAPSKPIADVALTPADFPGGYTATAVAARDLPNVLTDIAGSASDGTTVTPAGCAPAALPSDPDDASVLVATTEAGTLTVATVRVDGDLTQQTVNPCSSYTINELGAVARVSTTALPPSPVESDASVAFRRVRNTGGGQNLKQTTTLLVAQNGPIRVYATYLTFGGRKLDGQALDQVFTAAVQKSRS